jgi:hypothetical protein
MALARGFFFGRRRRGCCLFQAVHLSPTLALRFGDGVTRLGAQLAARLNRPGGGHAARRLAATGEDRTDLAQPCDLFIDGYQYLLVQGSSFRGKAGARYEGSSDRITG